MKTHRGDVSTSRGVTRRDFLRATGTGAASASLATVLAPQPAAARTPDRGRPWKPRAGGCVTFTQVSGGVKVTWSVRT